MWNITLSRFLLCVVFSTAFIAQWKVAAGPLDPCLLCSCTKTDSGDSNVICKSVSFHEIPHTFPIRTSILKLMDTTLGRLQANAFEKYSKLNELILKMESVSHLDAGALQGLNQLEILNIKTRRDIYSIPIEFLNDLNSVKSVTITSGLIEVPEALCSLRILRRLFLPKNKITSAKFPSCFDDLESLRWIDLQGNLITAIEPDDFYSLRNIKVASFNIAENPIRNEIAQGSFMYLNRLGYLTISKVTASITVDAFEKLRGLKELHVRLSNLSRIPLLSEQSPIKTLDISGNKDINHTFPSAYQHYRELHSVDLSGIKITHVQTSMFEYLDYVQNLRLSHCSIENVTSGAFRNMRNLSMLDLTSNKMSPAVLKYSLFGINANISVLSLNNNNFSTLTGDTFRALYGSKLTELFLQDCMLENLPSVIFRGLANVKHLHLSNNPIQTLARGIFNALVSLERLDLDRCHLTNLKSASYLGLSVTLKSLSVADNQLIFLDLGGYHALEFLNVKGNRIKSKAFATYENMTSLKILVLQRNRLTFIPFTLLQFTPNLEELDLERNHLSSYLPRLKKPLPLLPKLRTLLLGYNLALGTQSDYIEALTHNLPSLETLRMINCGVKEIPLRMFQANPRLVFLHLAHNSISSWDGRIFAPVHSLKELYLANNKIAAVFNQSFSHLQHLQQLDLSGNTFACDCDLLWFKQWASQQKLYLLGYSEYKCSTPTKDVDKWISDMSLTSYECKVKWKLVIVLTISIPVVALAIIVALIYKFRWHIRYVAYLTRTRRRRYRTEGDQTHYMFDAFVAFSLPDRKWVVNQLLPELEYKEGLGLCIHYRNWMAGADTTELIQASVDHCRKTIVVLSNSFAKSKWCQLELTQAHRRVLDGFKDTCILVLLEDILAENQTALIRHLLTSVNYLPWPGVDKPKEVAQFWRMLASSTRKPNRRLRDQNQRVSVENSLDMSQTTMCHFNEQSPLLFPNV